jgi:molybdopterin/thiamine biosynthesis adenylyltransferase/rhodanese-related sulfurtransferase
MAQITLDELKRRLDVDPSSIVLDVREAAEVRDGTIPGAIWIPLGDLDSEMVRRVPSRTTAIVTFCAMGARAATAATKLRAFGYENVDHASPGFVRWRERGLPVAALPTVPPSTLTPAQRERYGRHLVLPEVGEQGQTRLLASKVLLLGAGGLGSPAAMYLAAAGVGTLGIVDHDVVDASNLQRQILHRTADVGMPKVESAVRTLGELDPELTVVPHHERLTSANVERLFAPYDLIVDGTDNFPTRYLVNDASIFLAKPVVHGSVFRFDGQVTTFVPRRGPCYRCLFPEPPPAHVAPSCAEAGVLGILCGVIGTLQATEAIKLLLDRGEPLVGRLLTWDALGARTRELRFERDPKCPVCGDAPTLRSYVDYEAFCGARP